MIVAPQLQKILFFCIFLAVIFLFSRVINRSTTEVDDNQVSLILKKLKGGEASNRALESPLPPCKLHALENKTEFYEYFTKYDLVCKDKKFFGRGPDAKGVCLDPEFGIKKGDCNVLSFGINNEWSFDDAFAKHGCKVYCFDPTMGKEDFNRSESIRFFNLGLGNIQGQRKIGMNGRFRMLNVDRYENILQRLGLTHKKIDYLKLDIEISELEFFQDIFGSSPHLIKNIKQMAVEVHHGDYGEGIYDIENQIDEMGPMSAYQLFWQYIQMFKCSGFRLIEARKNWKWTEAVWANP